MQVRKEIEEIKFEQSFPEDLYLVLVGLVKQVLPKKPKCYQILAAPPPLSSGFTTHLPSTTGRRNRTICS
jgi:hypothetical protein